VIDKEHQKSAPNLDTFHTVPSRDIAFKTHCRIASTPVFGTTKKNLLGFTAGFLSQNQTIFVNFSWAHNNPFPQNYLIF
jgi:hypothetical protein